MQYATFHHNQSFHHSGVRMARTVSDTGIVRSKRLRLAALAVIMLFCIGFGALIHTFTGDNEVQAADIPVLEQIVVKPGDTLWSIAEQRVQKSEDVRIYIQKLKKANGLTSSALQAGQVLQLP